MFFFFIQMYKMCWSLMRVRLSLTLKEYVVKAEKGQRETSGIVTIGISAIMKMFAQKLRSPPSLPQALLISHSPSVALALLLSPSALSSSNATLEAWSLPCEYETAEMAISEFTSIYSLRDRRGKKERESENGKEKDKGWAMKGY